MAKGIRIDFLADVRDFLRGTKDVERSLDDVVDSLDDVAKEGDQAADKLEKSFRDALDDTKHRAADAGDDIGKRVKHGADEASQGMEDFKDNTKANLKETAASFGSVEDALGGIQGLASEALEGFGPAGAAAGAAAAIGIGLATSKLQAAAEKTNEAAEAAGEWALAWRDAGTTADRAQLLADGFDEIAGKIGDARHAWEVWQKDAVTNAEAFSAAIDAGALSVGDLQTAFTDLDPSKRIAAARRASAELERQLTQTNDAWDNTKVSTQLASGTLEAHTGLTQKETDALKATKKAIDEKAKADADAQKVLEAYAKSSGLTVDAYLKQQQAARDTAESLDSYGDALEAIADPIDTFNELLGDGAKKAKVTIGSMIRDLEDKVAERKTFERNLRTLARKGGGALVDELRAQGPQAAGAVTSVLAKGTSKEVRRYATLHAREVGVSAATGMETGVKTANINGAVQAAIDKTKPPQVPIEPKLGSTKDAEKDYSAFIRSLERKYPPKISFHGGTKPGAPND